MSRLSFPRRPVVIDMFDAFIHSSTLFKLLRSLFRNDRLEFCSNPGKVLRQSLAQLARLVDTRGDRKNYKVLVQVQHTHLKELRSKL